MTVKHISAGKRSKESYSRFVRFGYLMISILLLGVGGWSFLAKIQGAVIATGIVIVESKPKVIQHLDGGIIGEILVKDGDYVQKGQVLLRLDPTTLKANQLIVQKRLYESMARVTRLEAERDGLSQIPWSDEFISEDDNAPMNVARLGQEKLFEARRRTDRGQVTQLQQRIDQANNQINGIRSMKRAKQAQLDLITKELSGLQTLLSEGHVSSSRVLSIEREQARLDGEIANLVSDEARIKSNIGEIQTQILQVRKDRQEAILTELRQAQADVNDQKEQLVTASKQFERIDVQSPVEGIVHNMTATTIGGVVAPGQDVMQIIPQTDQLIIDAQVLTQDIDQVYEGQPVNVRFSAFNQRKTPELSGMVKQASADAIVDPITGMPYYSVKIEVLAEELEKFGNLKLIPGMPAEVFIQTESRSVISYILKPVSDAMERSMREE